MDAQTTCLPLITYLSLRGLQVRLRRATHTKSSAQTPVQAYMNHKLEGQASSTVADMSKVCSTVKLMRRKPEHVALHRRPDEGFALFCSLDLGLV